MRWILVVAIVMGTFGTAAAQMVPPPMVEEPKMMAGASVTAWIPQGDAEDLADTSLGLRGTFSYKLRPFVAILGTFDYIFVNEDGDGDATYYNISAGARLIKPRPGQLEPYAELLLGYHVLDADGLDDSESAIGFRIGGGILYPVGNKLTANFGLGYSAASFDVGIVEVDIDAFILEAGIGARF